MSIALIGPDGHRYALDNPAELDAALSAGYRTAEDGEGNTFAAEAKDKAETFAGGMLGGITAGFAPAILDKKSTLDATEYPTLAANAEANRQQRKALYEENPGTKLAGEVVGALISPLNKLIPGTTAPTVWGRIVRAGSAAAPVGALQGAGSFLSEAALGDVEVTADKLLASAGLGALLGFGGAGIGQTIGEVAGAVLPKLGQSVAGAQKALDDIANDAAVQSTRAQQGVINNLGEKDLEAAARFMREKGLTKVMESPDDLLKAVRGMRDEEAAGLLKAMGAGAEDLRPGMTNEEAAAVLERSFAGHNDEMQRVYAAAHAAGARPSLSELRAAVGGARKGLNPAEADTLEPHIQRLEGFLDDLGRKPAGTSSFGSLNDLRSTLQNEIKPLYRSGDSNAANLRKNLVRLFKDNLDDQLERGLAAKNWVQGPKDFEAFAGAKRGYSVLARADDALGRKTATGAHALDAMLEATGIQSPSIGTYRALQTIENLADSGSGRAGGIGMKDLLAGALGGSFHPAGIAAVVASKFMREKGPAIVAKAADAIAKSPALAAIAASMGKKIGGLNLGPYAPALTQAFAVNPAVGLATHMAMAQTDPNYAATVATSLEPEDAQTHTASLTKAHGLAAIVASAQKADADLKRQVAAIVKGAASAESPHKVFGRQDFGEKRMRRSDGVDQRMKEVRELATDPSAFLDRLAPNLEEVGRVAPGLASTLTARAQTAVQYLAQSAEMPMTPPLAAKWQPTEAEQHDFAVKLQVVEQPSSVLEHAAAGTLTDMQVDALKAVYPQLWRQWGDAALEAAFAAKHVPYTSKMMLQTLTGMDLDGTLTQDSIARNQTAIYATPEPAKPAEPGASQQTLASRLATPQQRKEMET